MRDTIFGPDKVHGRVKAYRVREPDGSLQRTHSSLVRADLSQLVRLPGLWTPSSDWHPNQVVYEWGAIVSQLLMRKGLQYGISGAYLEFANVGSPGDTVPVPDQDRTRDIEYYNGLTTFDYLRVPLTASTFSSSGALFAKGNSPTFFVRSSGLQGVRNGLPFSADDNSVIFGAALVAFVSETDYTQDLIFSSFYFDESEQQPKLSTSQVGLEWQLILE